VEGAQKGSTTLVFEPGKGPTVLDTQLSPAFKKVTIEGETVYQTRLDIGTAGATGLALQAILPFILVSSFPSAHPIRLVLTGGTNVSGSPSYEYLTQVLLPMLRLIGFPDIRPQLKRRGWSQGGSSIGEIAFDIPPRPSVMLPSFRLHRDIEEKHEEPTHLQATFVAPSSCHGHFRSVLVPAISHHFGGQFSVEARNLDIRCEGSLHEKRMYFILVATIPLNTTQISDARDSYKLARDWLYERKIRSHERAATEMAESVTNALASEVESGAFVDEHMRDQLVIFQALAKGTSQVYAGIDDDGELREPSLHTRTAEFVAKQMLGVKFDTSNACEGIAFGEGRQNETMPQSREIHTATEPNKELERLTVR
jgi:RNA 3'-terminal phosphate cyclase (ATP)